MYCIFILSHFQQYCWVSGSSKIFPSHHMKIVFTLDLEEDKECDASPCIIA